MADVLTIDLDGRAVRRFSSLQSGFAFLDAPGGSQVPDEVGDAIARALREASANLGARLRRRACRVKEILETAEAKAPPRFLGCDPHEIIFGPNMTSLDFTLSRTAGRELRARRRDPRLLARPRRRRRAVARARPRPGPRRQAHRAAARHDARLRRPRARSSSERTRVVAFAWASNAIGTIVDAARVCELAHDGRRARLDRRRPLRRPRADRRARDRRRRADLLAVQVLRPASRHRLRPGRGARDVAPVQGAAGADRPARAALRDRHAALRAARRLQRDDRLPASRSAASRRSSRTSARWASGSSRHLRTRSRSTGCRRWRAACRRSWSTSTACRRRDVAATSPSATSASGRTTPGTRWTSTSASATSTTRSGSASSTTTRTTRSTG